MKTQNNPIRPIPRENCLLEREYQIPFSHYFTTIHAFQRHFVYLRNTVFTVIFLILAVLYIYKSVSDSDSLSRILAILFLAMPMLMWYNTLKFRRSLLNAIREMDMEHQPFRMQLYDAGIVLQQLEQIEQPQPKPDAAAEDASEDDTEHTEPDAAITESDLPEPSELRFDSGILIWEYDEFFMIVQEKRVFYLLPKAAFDDAECQQMRTLFTERLQTLFVNRQKRNANPET